MRPWQHSHNLRQTTRERLEGVLRELEAERASPQAPDRLAADQQPDLQSVDQALLLLREALKVLSGE